MKQILIALALALGATAAVADPTLSNAQNEHAWNKASEATGYQAAGLVDDNAPGYPFNP
jgi:hypothetical protein